MKEKWAISDDEENYHGGYSSREDAIERGPDDLDLENGQPFWVAKCVPWELKINADMIIETLVDEAYEEVGDHAEGFLQNVSPEQADVLSATVANAINEWMKSYGYIPEFFAVEDPEKVILYYDVV